MSDDGWEQASVSKSFITGDGCAGHGAHQTSTGAHRSRSRPIPSVSHLTRRLWKSDGLSWRWGGMEGEIRAYPNKLISTISARFLPMDPWSAPKVWLHTVVTWTTGFRVTDDEQLLLKATDMISEQVLLQGLCVEYFTWLWRIGWFCKPGLFALSRG